MNYQIQGLSIHAEVHGTAEPALVFLHYWGGTSRTWRKVTAELEGQFKTVAYDARGWGKIEPLLDLRNVMLIGGVVRTVHCCSSKCVRRAQIPRARL